MTWAAVIAVASVAAVSGAYLAGESAGRNAERATTARLDAMAAKAGDTAASAAAAVVSRIRVQNTLVRQEVQREIQDRPVYRDCAHSADQLQRINAAIAGADQQPGGADRDGMPAADATH